MPTTPKLHPISTRLPSIDLLRGAVMIIMAIDHVRVYSGQPAGGPTAGIFFTRWITHFCAPAFAFFAGTSAFLYLQKTGDKGGLARFLLSRGLLLVLLELTLIRFFWMFNLDFANFTFTGVIWMLGWCMILLAAFVRLKPAAIGITGLIIIFIQQVFHYIPNIFPTALQPAIAKAWAFFYPWIPSNGGGGSNLLSGASGVPKTLGISIFYVIIPWIGVMMAGFGFGQLLRTDPEKRKKTCLRIGISAIILFIVAGTINIFTQSGNETPFLFQLLGQQKYPPSQLYLLMTLGPVIALLPWAEKCKGRLADALITVGRVPMFYYLIHIFLIHLSALLVNLLLSGATHQEWYTTAPFLSIPADQRWSLPLLYLVWFTDICTLFFICRWYARYKSAHPNTAWLKYL